MTRRLRIPMMIVLLLLIGTTEGPRLVPAVVHAAQNIDWSVISDAFRQAGETITGLVAQGATLFGWSTLAFGIGAAVLLVGTFATLALLLWPSRRAPKVRRGSRKWTRRHEVGHRARAGETVPVIARETRLSQDAIRTLIAAR